MIAFADSSALVKLYVAEAGHSLVRRQRDLVVSDIAGVEVPAAFWRKHRTGALDVADARLLTALFQADFFGTPAEVSRFEVIEVSATILDFAADLVARHPLRAYDAVQLSSALAVRRVEPGCSTLITFDAGLAKAAAGEGLTVKGVAAV